MDERERQKLLPPDEIRFVGATGPLIYAECYDDDGLAGYVWCTVDRDRVPRAGIVLLPTTERDPSEIFQEDLGEVTLRERHNSEVNAHEFLTYLAETRDGLGGKVAIHDVRSASSLDSLRAMAGHRF